MHYHLGGSYDEFLKDGVNNLLHNAAANLGIDFGCRLLHLGGGLETGDQLHKFKQSIGDVNLDWYLGKAVLDSQAYNSLVVERAAHLEVPKTQLLSCGYFPAYRAQATSKAAASFPPELSPVDEHT